MNPQPFADPNGHGWQWHGGPALERAGYGAPYIHCDLGEHFERAMLAACPFGRSGERLWVRESYRLCAEFDAQPPSSSNAGNRVWYEADAPHQPGFGKGRPSIHMPRWASRILLDISGVRVERLQAISEGDARAEGCPGGHGAIPGYAYHSTPIEQFTALWKSLYGAESWDENPWMWVIDFKEIKA